MHEDTHACTARSVARCGSLLTSSYLGGNKNARGLRTNTTNTANRALALLPRCRKRRLRRTTPLPNSRLGPQIRVPRALRSVLGGRHGGPKTAGMSSLLLGDLVTNGISFGRYHSGDTDKVVVSRSFALPGTKHFACIFAPNTAYLLQLHPIHTNM